MRAALAVCLLSVTASVGADDIVLPVMLDRPALEGGLYEQVETRISTLDWSGGINTTETAEALNKVVN